MTAILDAGTQARGLYIKFLFGDDVFCSPRTVSTLVALMESHPSVVLASSARRVINADSRSVELWDHLGRAGAYPGRAIITRCLAEDRNLIGEPSAVPFRRQDAARGFNPEYRQWVDLELMRLLGRGWYFAYWVRRNIIKALVTLRHNWQRHVLDWKPVSLRRWQRHRE